MNRYRRPMPSLPLLRRGTRKCKCGCKEQVTGRFLFYSAACRKRYQRFLDETSPKPKPKKRKKPQKVR